MGFFSNQRALGRGTIPGKPKPRYRPMPGTKPGPLQRLEPKELGSEVQPRPAPERVDDPLALRVESEEP